MRRAVWRPDTAEAGAGASGSRRDPRHVAGLIDLAEDRQRFNQLLWDLGIPQPSAARRRREAEAREVAAKVGFPVVVRPSFGRVGGRDMAIVYDVAHADRDMATAVDASHDRPILM